MTFTLWWTFSVATFLICLSPGPNMLLMLKSGIEHGFRRTMLFTSTGCFLGVLILIGGSVLGVGAALQLYPSLYRVLCIVGALYLIFIGVQSWRTPVSVGDGEATHEASGKALFRKGFLVAMSNPKALLFAAAFFPQFINPELPQIPQMAVMLVTFTVLEFACYAAYAAGGEKLAAIMRRAEVRRRVQRATGSLFMLFGVLLLIKSA
jgi:threonine/homoserine/homoserine lactone efflux protein